MDPNDKVMVLLKEYDSLRAEILQRIGHRFAFVGLAGAVGTYVFFVATEVTVYQTFVLITSALALFGVWFRQGALMARCSKRIAEIEKAVNSIAGEELLKWEHEKPASKLFYKAYR